MPGAFTVQHNLFFGCRSQLCVVKHAWLGGHQVRQVTYALRRFFFHLAPTDFKGQLRGLNGVLERGMTHPLQLRQPLVVAKLIQHDGAPHTQALH